MGESPDLAVPPPPPAHRGGRARAVTAARKVTASPAAGNLAKYGLGFGALAFVLWKYWSQLRAQFQQSPHWEYLAAAAALAFACTAIQLFRWYLLVRALGLPFAGRGVVRLGLVGYYYNSFLPGSVGGDAVKMFFIARGHPERRAAAVATVAADRLIGLFGLILYVAAVGGGCWLAGNAKVAGNDYLTKMITVCAGLAGAAVAGYLLLTLAPDRLDRAVRAKLPKPLAELWGVGWTYSRRPGTVLAAVGLSAVIHTGFVLIFHFAVRAFPPGDPAMLGSLPEHFVIAPLGYIAQAFFPAPGGVGGGEAVFGYLYTLIKGDSKEAEAVGVAGRLSMRLVEWTLGLIGYVTYLRMRDESAGS